MHGTSSELTRLVNHVNNVVLVLSIAFELFLSQLSIHTERMCILLLLLALFSSLLAHRNCCLYLACGLVMSEASTLRVEPARDQRSRAVEEVRWMRWAQHQKEQVRIGKPWFGERSFLFCQAFYPSKNPRAQKKCKKTWYMLPTCWWRHTHTHTHTKCVVAKSLESFSVLPQFLQNCLFAQGRKPSFDSYHCDIYDWWTFRRKNLQLQSFCCPFQQCLGSWSSLLKRCSPLSLLLGPCCLLLFQWPRTLPSLTACYFRVRFRYLCLYVLENDAVFIMKGSGGNLARTKLYVFGGFSRCLHQCSYIMKLNMCESWSKLQYTIHEHTPHPKRSPPTHTPPVV